MPLPKLLIFASGDAEGGGSGFQELVENSRTIVLCADIVGVVSNHEHGGVRKRADALGIPFQHMPKPFTAEAYRAIVEQFGADFVSLSGWLKPVHGLNPATTINIHPGPLPEFGGKGMYGHHVHEAVMQAYHAGDIQRSHVTMHFVTEEYDRGPVFFEYPVLIRPEDTPDTLAARVNKIEHGWQSFITNLVVNGVIRLEGGEIVAPDWYTWYR